MYKITVYSFLLCLCIACAWDRTDTAAAEDTNPPQDLPVMEDPVVVTLDSIAAEEARTPEINPDLTIKGIEETGNFTKATNAAEKANSPQGFSYTALAKKSFKCMGNEPFWNIEIKGDELMFHQMGYEKETYTLQATQVKSDRLVYAVQEGTGKNTIQVQLLKENCEDDMSGQPFAYSVVLTKNGKEYRGCAKEILQ